MIKWNKITDSNSVLPKDGQSVLVTVCFINLGDFDFDVITADYDEGFNLVIGEGYIYDEDSCTVIAWADKPDPYKSTV